MSLEAATADAVSSALLSSPFSALSSVVSSADRSARASRPPPPAPPVTPERGARKRSLEMLRTAGDSTLCDGPTEDQEAAMGMVVTSSLEKTDDDVTSSALSLTTSEHDQGAGDFSSPPRPACPPAWMARLTWAPRVPKMSYSSLRVRYGDDVDACLVPMKSRKIDRTPIHLEL